MMPKRATGCGLILVVSITAATPGQILLDKLRGRVIENLKRAPRYTCMETITRVQYRPLPGDQALKCRALIARELDIQYPRVRAWRDRLRVDVAMGKNSEIFSWAGAREFEAGNVQELALAGVSGTGDFSSFLTSIFEAGGADFRFTGQWASPSGGAAGFEYKLPLNKSQYTYDTGDGVNRTVAYHGHLFVDPATAELRRLIVDADQFPVGSGVCQVLHTIDYQRARIGDGEFSLPKKAQLTVLYSDGQEAINESQFASCHEYVSDSTLRFDDSNASSGLIAMKTSEVVRTIPPKTRLQVRIDPPVDAATAAAGDTITGVIAHEVKNSNEIVVREGDELQGRLLRVEQRDIGVPIWTVSIQFDTLSREGRKQPIRLKPLDDGERFLVPRFMVLRRREGRPVIPERPQGGGVFLLEGVEMPKLDRSFHTSWVTQD